MRPRTRRRRLPAGRAVALITLLGCAAETDRPSTPATGFDTAPESVTTRLPDLSESAVDDSSAQIFRVSAVAPLGDGGFALGNSGAGQIRLYDPSGRFVRALGRPGSGPGEFQLLGPIWAIAPDSIMAWDVIARKLVTFTSTGEVIHETRLEPAPAVQGPHVIGRFADGALAVTGSRQRLALEPSLVGKMVRDSTVVAAFDAGGAFKRRLAAIPGTPRFVMATSGPVRWPFVPFHSGAILAVLDSSVATSDGRGMIDVIGGDGRTIESIVLPIKPALVTSDDVERVRERALATAKSPDERTLWERFYRDAPYPDTMPVIREMLSDGHSRLLIRLFERPGAETTRWSLYDISSRHARQLILPPRFRPLALGDTILFGVRFDSLDVEHVERYRLPPR